MICRASVSGETITITMAVEPPIVLIAKGALWSGAGASDMNFMIDGGTFGQDSDNTYSGGNF